MRGPYLPPSLDRIAGLRQLFAQTVQLIDSQRTLVLCLLLDIRDQSL